MKGLLENIVLLLCGASLEARAADVPGYSPAASAEFLVRGTKIGSGGEISAKTAKHYGLGTKVLAAEIDLTALFDIRRSRIRYREIGRFPAAKRDLAVVVDQEQGAGDILAEIRRTGGAPLEKARLLSVYAGDRVEAGKKSVAVSLSFRAGEGTMKDEQVEQLMAKILRKLEKKFGARLR